MRVLYALVALLVCATLILPTSALAQPSFTSTSTSLLSRDDVRAAVSADAMTGPLRHLDGTLQALHAARQAYLADQAAGLTRLSFDEAVGLSAVAGERVIIDAFAHTEGGVDALASDLAALGFKETGRFRHIVSGRLPVDAIADAAALSTLRSAAAALAAVNRIPAEQIEALRAVRDARPGSIIGEASVALRVDGARTQYGIDGSGITIGVLSDSYDTATAGGGAAGGVTSGDLPASVNVLDEFDSPGPGIDEGRAMIEVAFDVAPGADFAFHTAVEGQASFAQGITDLRNAGSDVVVDDIIYFSEPYFQDGIIAQSADASFAAGVPYFSSAGNAGNRGYEALFVDSGTSVTVGGRVCDLHDFDPGPGVDFLLSTSQAGAVNYSLHYDEPSVLAGAGQAPTSDYALGFFLGGSTVDVFDSNNAASGLPFESAELNGTGTFNILILRCSGDARQVAVVPFGGNSLFNEYGGGESGGATSYGHANAAGAFGVGAAPWFDTPPFTAAAEAVPESFTAYGGVLVRLNADGTFKATPEDREKPDVTASDADNNTFFGFDATEDPDTNPNFFGTSAAAPNLAAVAALMLEVAGGPGTISPSQIYAALEGTADDITASAGTAAGYDRRTGNGFVRGDLAIAAFASAQAVAGNAGWRLLAPPAPGLTVADLAEINRLSGIPGFDEINNPGGNPTSVPNILTDYDGITFFPPTGGSEALPLGEGFWWYFYDVDFTDGPTNPSIALPFTLAVSAAPTTSDVDVTLHDDNTKVNMLGNPFGESLDLSGAASWTGAGNLFTPVFAIYNAGSNSYAFSTTQPVVAPWQGFFAYGETAGTLTIPESARTTGGMLSREADERVFLAFELTEADLADGQEPLADHGAVLYFDEFASVGEDPFDLAKLAPLDPAHVLLAFEAISNEGEPVLRGHEGRSLREGASEIPLHVRAAGSSETLTLSWPTLDRLPADWTVMLRDTQTGTEVDLRSETSYTFEVTPESLSPQAGLTVPAPRPIALPGTRARGESARFMLAVTPPRSTSEEVDGGLVLALGAPVPNPASGEATLRYVLPTAGAVRVDVVDLLGRTVTTLVDGERAAGVGTAVVDVRSLASGVYAVRLVAGEEMRVTRLTVTR
ncbi:MAG: T9SS type A sorting domain-containing protein [Bacteroidota bacterium]